MTITQSKTGPMSRKGGIARRLLIGLVVATSGIAVAWGGIHVFRGDGSVQVITRQPTFGEFITDIVERGDVESSSNTELRCEVSSAEGVRILDIVPEGTLVNPGDVVVQLDDSTIRKELSTQRISVNTIEAAYSKAKNELEAEVIARKEYEEGTFVQEELKLESEMFVAQENSRRAGNVYSHSRVLAARGYITDAQLEGDRFSVDKHQKDLDVVLTKLKVIREYTKPKTLKKHDSTIKIAEAAVAAEKSKYEIEQEKLANLESQLAKCIIKATSTGQVVYNNQDRWRGDDFFIRKGNRVRERQVIVKLPDTGKMQVKAKISEARVDRVKPGMTATIRVEALRGAELKGVVKTVSAYASDENWFNPNSKDYDAIITISDPTATLKPGMTSQVSIRVETQPEALQIPVQCVVQRSGKHYAVVRETATKLALRELEIGSTNDKFIIVKSGVERNDDVVMNPRAHTAKLGLKDVDASTDKAGDEKKSDTPATPVAGDASAKGTS